MCPRACTAAEILGGSAILSLICGRAGRPRRLPFWAVQRPLLRPPPPTCTTSCPWQDAMLQGPVALPKHQRHLREGRPPHVPAFLGCSAAFAAAASACLRAFSSFAALSGSVMRWTASFTFVPPSMGSSGSFRSLHQHNALSNAQASKLHMHTLLLIIQLSRLNTTAPLVCTTRTAAKCKSGNP